MLVVIVQSRIMRAYHERLVAPPSWWAGVIALAVACGWVVLVATTLPAGLVTAVVVAGAAGAGLFAYGRVPVQVDDSAFNAGSATLPMRFIGTVEILDPPTWRHYLGPGADARAFVVSRPYVTCGVLVAVTDRQDPAPYWLVSSRQPAQLAQALGERGAPTHDRRNPSGENT